MDDFEYALDFYEPMLAMSAFSTLCGKYGEPVSHDRHRMIFESKYVVVKFARNPEGLRLNLKEHGRHGVPVPKSRFISVQGVPCLMMQKVKMAMDLTDLPEWASLVLNVGYTRANKLVAFDL